jgi:D-alanyl-lipoteichoic acid acyltransferase DltB (MBOAT superfamily)
MIFNSIDFAIFLPIVFILYWFVTNKNLKVQNLLLLVASYIFYGWWDWRFLGLIIFSSFIDYHIGVQLSKTDVERKRKVLLWTSILVNISFLGFFKYFNFFLDNFTTAFSFFGQEISSQGLNIVLPVGISFYTFQTLSYSIDVYKRKLEPTKDIIAFFTYVGFFPQLVAGPIERAKNLLPQFYIKRKFDSSKASDGMRQILWGLFKKTVVADNLSTYVELVFDNTSEMSSFNLLMGLALFSIQIYADFSGYSDIAIGTARLFGFNFQINFKYPLFARSIGERWRNWHISLSTWFRDYIYIPMGGSRVNKWMRFRNLMILFTISGFWHGANWTFLFWGILNGLFFAPSMLLKKNRKYLEPIGKNKMLPSLKEAYHMFVTFSLISFTYIFFRANNITHSKEYFLDILHNYNLPLYPTKLLGVYGIRSYDIVMMVFFILIMFIFEWYNRDKDFGLFFKENHKHPIIRWSIYVILIVIITLWAGQTENFIYFQF